MITRVTDQMKYALLTNNLFNVQNQYNDLMNQLSTEKRINRPSDDPLGMNRVMDYRTSLASIDQYQKNIDDSTSWLNITESKLTSVNDILVKIQETTVSQGSDTASAATRRDAATALQPLIDELLSLANSKIGDRYIFAGTRTDTKPFAAETGVYTGGPAAAAGGNTYTGDATASGTYTGAANATYVVKIAAAGDLNAATYRISADGGKTWGAESAVGDMSTGTISLGDGLSLTFDAGTFGAGDVFSVQAFVSGQYRGNGEELAANIGKDNTFSYGISGEAVFTDKGNGEVDIFKTLNDLKTALEGNNADGIRSQLDNLKKAQQQVTRYTAQCGTRTNSLEVTKNNYDALKTSITGLMSNIEDADITQLITDFNMKAVALQASYSMAAQIGKISILDFLG